MWIHGELVVNAGRIITTTASCGWLREEYTSLMSKLQILGYSRVGYSVERMCLNGTQDSTSGRLQEPETPVRDLDPSLPGLGATPVTRNSGFELVCSAAFRRPPSSLGSAHALGATGHFVRRCLWCCFTYWPSGQWIALRRRPGGCCSLPDVGVVGAVVPSVAASMFGQEALIGRLMRIYRNAARNYPKILAPRSWHRWWRNRPRLWGCW